MPLYILTINPGSTSTKLSLFEDNELIFSKLITHSTQELAQFNAVTDQFVYRKDIIEQALNKAGIDFSLIDAVVGRGGLLKPIEGGVYQINAPMLEATKQPMGNHVSNIGVLLANYFSLLCKPTTLALMADPTCVDELDDIARISGMPELPRMSILHTLNQKAVAKKYAEQRNVRYEDIQVIVAHMGGGITVGAHKNGRIIDVNNGLNGEGPFSPERSGTVPAGQLVELCFSGKFNKEQLLKKIAGEGGLTAYLATNNFEEISRRAQEGDRKVLPYYHAMAYQVAKEIGALSTVLLGQAEAIILTGGIAHDKAFVQLIIDRVKHIAPIVSYPGQKEDMAMATYALAVLTQQVTPKIYV